MTGKITPDICEILCEIQEWLRGKDEEREHMFNNCCQRIQKRLWYHQRLIMKKQKAGMEEEQEQDTKYQHLRYMPWTLKQKCS